MSLLFLLFFGVFAIVVAFLLMNFFIIGAILLLLFGICATIIFNPMYTVSGICILGALIGIKFINKQLKKEGKEEKQLKMFKQAKMCCKAIIVFTVGVLLSYIIYSSVKYVKYSKAKKYGYKNQINVNELFNDFKVFSNFNPFQDNDNSGIVFDFQPVEPISINFVEPKQFKNDGGFSSYAYSSGQNYEYTLNNSKEKIKFSNNYGFVKIKKEKEEEKIKGKCKNGKKIEAKNKVKNKILGQNKLLMVAEKVLFDNCADKKEQQKNKEITTNNKTKNNEVSKKQEKKKQNNNNKKDKKEACCSNDNSKKADKNSKKK